MKVKETLAWHTHFTSYTLQHPRWAWEKIRDIFFVTILLLNVSWCEISKSLAKKVAEVVNAQTLSGFLPIVTGTVLVIMGLVWLGITFIVLGLSLWFIDYGFERLWRQDWLRRR